MIEEDSSVLGEGVRLQYQLHKKPQQGPTQQFNQDDETSVAQAQVDEPKPSPSSLVTSLCLPFQATTSCIQLIILAYYENYGWVFVALLQNYQDLICCTIILGLTVFHFVVKSPAFITQTFVLNYDRIKLLSGIVCCSLVLVTLRIPFSSLFFVSVLVVLIKVRKITIRLTSSKPLLCLYLQIFLIFLRLDGWLQLPWLLLLFEAPFLLSLCLFILFVLTTQMMKEIQKRAQKAYLRKNIFCFLHIIQFVIQSAFFFFIICNWATFDLNIPILLQVILVTNLIFMVEFSFLLSEITYGEVFSPFKIFYRLSPNRFSERYHRGLDPNTNFPSELCNKCSKNQANALFEVCGHLTVCTSCLRKCKMCPYCKGNNLKCGRISWKPHWESQQFKINFYRQNEFKVFLK